MNLPTNAVPGYLAQLPMPVDGPLESSETPTPPGANVVTPSNVAGPPGVLRSVICTSQGPTTPALSAANAVMGLSAAAPIPSAPADAPIKSCRRLSLSLTDMHPLPTPP